MKDKIYGKMEPVVNEQFSESEVNLAKATLKLLKELLTKYFESAPSNIQEKIDNEYEALLKEFETLREKIRENLFSEER
jgi:methionyl-tRNA synthetase